MIFTFLNYFIAFGNLIHKENRDEANKIVPFDLMSDHQRLEYLRAVKNEATRQGKIAPRIDAYISAYELLCEDWTVDDDDMVTAE